MPDKILIRNISLMTPDKSRRVRVFVSSTFLDMQEERDELAKRIFPQLRKLCEERDIEWGEVDLRWGITEEQSERGETLPICLAEIERCRPYFIGILGERYGWVPEEIPRDLKNQHPWLDEHDESSVTALEILHGVLNNPIMADRSFLYFRDRGYIQRYLEQNPDAKITDLCDLPMAEESAAQIPDDKKQRENARRARLEKLKDDIRNSGLPVRENYRDPQEFGRLVLKDLIDVILRFPPPVKLDALGREAAAHESFATSRFGVYIKQQQYFDVLYAHADGDGLPLVITGESGSGKSALLAHWANQCRGLIQIASGKKYPNISLPERPPLLLTHFVGATVESTDYSTMLRRIIGELKQYFSIDTEIPEKPEELRAAFPNWLSMAAAHGRVILIIDALNQLEDLDGAPDLVWLPSVIPPQVRLILSTLPGRSLTNLNERNWPTMNVEPLTLEERRVLLYSYLAQYRRTPSDELVKKITNASQTKNPLYLRSLLEELRLYGDHDTLIAEAERYLAADNPENLFQHILARWERDYNRDRPELVQDVMTCLWAARRGLTEQELLGLLRNIDNPLPTAFWSPLSLAADKALINRSGFLSFSHDYLRSAVEKRYLMDENDRKHAHLRIAEYFKQKDASTRTLEELPWQYHQAEAWELLHQVLQNPIFFKSLYTENLFDAQRYWVDLENTSLYDIIDTYRCVLEQPQKYQEYLWEFSSLFTSMGKLKEAFTLQEYLRQYFYDKNDLNRYQTFLGNESMLLFSVGHVNEAMKFLKEQERICRDLGDEHALQSCLGNQAIILKNQGNFKLAMDLLKDQERICRDLGNEAGLHRSLGNQSNILVEWNRLDEAMDLLKEQEMICRQLGDMEGLQISLGNQGRIHGKRNRLKEAMELYKQKEQICREHGNKNGLQKSLVAQALVLQDWGRSKEALDLLNEQERICRDLGNKMGIQESFGAQAYILRKTGLLKEAMDLLKQREKICRDLGNMNEVQRSLGEQVRILLQWERWKEAMDLLKEQEKICRDLGNMEGLQESLASQSLVHYGLGKLTEAMDLRKEQEKICIAIGHKEGIQESLGVQALILINEGKLKDAMTVLKNQEKICRDLGNQKGLLESLDYQAMILRHWQQWEEAIKIHIEQEMICRFINDNAILHAVLGAHANILYSLGRVKEAMDFYNEKEQICRKIGDNDQLQRTLGIKAQILVDRERLIEAIDVLKEQGRICNELGIKNNLQLSIGKRATILYSLGKLEEALNLFREQESICREIGDITELRLSLGSQGQILHQLGRLHEALDYFKEEGNLCKELGDKNHLMRSLGNQALILQGLNRYSESITLLKEQEALCRDSGDDNGLMVSFITQAVVLKAKGNPEDSRILLNNALAIANKKGNTSLASTIQSELQNL